VFLLGRCDVFCSGISEACFVALVPSRSESDLWCSAVRESLVLSGARESGAPRCARAWRMLSLLVKDFREHPSCSFLQWKLRSTVRVQSCEAPRTRSPATPMRKGRLKDLDRRFA
jgi:hypothetical protein